MIEARRESDTDLRSMQVAFVESATLSPMTEAMIRIEKHFERLQQLGKSNWNANEAHPDWHAGHEALLLLEEYTELLRDDHTRSRYSAMLSNLSEAKASAEQLEIALNASSPHNTRIDPKVAAAFRSVTGSCANCHQRFRDNPIPK